MASRAWVLAAGGRVAEYKHRFADLERFALFAVIRAGGKQHKVAEGDVIEIERLAGADGTIEFTPLLVVDDDGNTRFNKSELASAVVTATILGETKGPKVEIFKHRNKTGYRRHAGHRQKYSSVQISGIRLATSRSKKTAPKKGGSDGT